MERLNAVKHSKAKIISDSWTLKWSGDQGVALTEKQDTGDRNGESSSGCVWKCPFSPDNFNEMMEK